MSHKRGSSLGSPWLAIAYPALRTCCPTPPVGSDGHTQVSHPPALDTCCAGCLNQLAQKSTDATRTERDTFGPLEVPADKCVAIAACVAPEADPLEHLGLFHVTRYCAEADCFRAEVDAGTGALRHSGRCRTSRLAEPLSGCRSRSSAPSASRSGQLPG